MRNFLTPVILSAFLLLNVVACSNSKKDDDVSSSGSGLIPLASDSGARGDDGLTKSAADLAKEVDQYLLKNSLYVYPELTVLLALNGDPRDASRKIVAAGGEIVYDPNLGIDYNIKFLVANLPPEKITDKEFIESLNLKAISVDNPKLAVNKILSNDTGRVSFNNIKIPTKEINIDALRAISPGRGLGEDVVVAVIDTGIDASHPIFEDRVIYWADLTRESKVLVHPIADNKAAGLPEELKDVKFYQATISERSLGVQLSEEERIEKSSGLDLNDNGQTDDEFQVILTYSTKNESVVAFIDLDGDGQFSQKEMSKPIYDFNFIKNSKKNLNGMIRFSEKANKIVSFPLLIATQKDNKEIPVSLTIGIDAGGHGTHVAGIIAGNGVGMTGAAPKAQLMALKACSGLTCTDAAIFKSLIESFYNPYNLRPDVVNISLGSHEQNRESFFGVLMRDLAAKFGATFFISASNSGPGFHSINDLGNAGPIVLVGAHVSKESLSEHYTIARDSNLPEQNLLYFSSVGPSYTGELRPHLVAPGSALSSAPLTQEKSAMWNGTSMSSPMTTGGAAALLSLAKTESAYGAFVIALDDRIKGNSGVTLTDYALALRMALMDTAKPLSDLTVAQQGYGLIDVNGAFKRYMELITKLDEKSNSFFELNINARKSSYDRSITPKETRTFTIRIEDDGERSEESTIMLQNSELKVKLSKVEVLTHDAKMQTLTTNLPFNLVKIGTNESSNQEMIVVPGIDLRGTFISQRKLSMMDEGKTYIAVYEVFSKDERINTILDVVHMPYDLSNVKNDLKRNGVKIGANKFHRYFVNVTPMDSSLTLDLNISSGVNGSLLYLVYDQAGRQLARAKIAKFPSYTGSSLVNKNFDVTGKPGIYEIVVAAADGRWMSDTSYDLKVFADRLVLSHKEINLKVGANVDFFAASGLAEDLTLESVEALAPNLVLSLNDIPVRSGFLGVKKLNLPCKEDAKVSEVELDVTFSDSQKNNLFFGRIDEKILTQDESGNWLVKYRSESTDQGLKKFKKVALQSCNAQKAESLFIGVETFGNYDAEATLKSTNSVDLDVYLNLAETPVIAVGIKSDNKNIIRAKIVAPKELKYKNLNSKAKGAIKLTTKNGKTIAIPYTISK